MNSSFDHQALAVTGDGSGFLINADRACGGALGFGFEGGRVICVEGEYHLFTAELESEPVWVQTSLAHWSSTDGVEWQRRSTVLRSTGDFTGDDPCAALFSPMPVFDSEENAWSLFFVAYRCAPDSDDAFMRNHGGRVLRAVSTLSGLSGIAGPYRTADVVLQPDEDTQSWEGLQGTDSFFPFQSGDSWLALYGSATTEYFANRESDSTRRTRWAVGLAESENLAGTWSRMPMGNPLAVEPLFIENPVVSTLPGGGFVALYDNGHLDPDLRRSFGVMTSADGVLWERNPPIQFPDSVAPWARTIRTPLGILAGEVDSVRVLFTAFESLEEESTSFGGRGHVGVVRLNIHRGDYSIGRQRVAHRAV